MKPALTISALLGALLLCGCPPQIGDSCNTSVDCSVNGDRLCDEAQPNGYCTVQSCEAGTCPEDAICVRFRPDPTRLERSYCMKPCNQDSDCREEDGYACVTAAELGCFEVETALPLLPLAEVLDEDRRGRPFCAAARNYVAIPCE